MRIRRILDKILIVVLLLTLMVPVGSSVALADDYGTSTMYVKTDNGKSVKVREKPNKKAKAVATVKYGQKVTWDWSYAGNDGWSKVIVSGKTGYLQSRYLVSKKPKAYKPPQPKIPSSVTSESYMTGEMLAMQLDLNKELETQKAIAPCYITVRPTRASGTVDFRFGPSTYTYVIDAFYSGKVLIAEGETTNWWQARDPMTDTVGYIQKEQANELDKPIAVEEASGTQKLGRLSVNGDFELTCKIPADYSIQVTNTWGENIVASILSDNITKPQMILAVVYDELYGDVERMNDMSDEDLAVLEASFAENNVDISYRETGLGTKLLVAREIGAAEDFVTILSVYKGYLVEFTMKPSSKAAIKVLTEEQIQTAIDFLTDVTFNPIVG